MARPNSIDDSRWPEVEKINSFAVFIGYLSMGVRGLSLLVVTWTTVVLLGGFVSDLHKKDFWSLTAITLIQTTGVFDFLIEEKSSDIVNSLKGLLAAIYATVVGPFKKGKGTSISEMDYPSTARLALAVILLVVQVLVLAVVLCPLVAIYSLGLSISTGIALWRLIEHDYGNVDGAANLKPALAVLYSLAVAQGLFSGYKAIYAWGARIGIVECVARNYKLPTSIVSDYLDEILKGCMKDPSFSRGRNLVTYAMNMLMEPKSPGSYLSGIWMISLILRRSYFYSGTLIRHLLTASSSFMHITQRLLDTLGPRSPYSSELRENAARIVAHVAGDIHLEHLPRGLQCISSLLEPFEEYCWRPEGYARDKELTEEYERDWLMLEHEREHVSLGYASRPPDSGLHGYIGLVVQGLCILQRLAVHEGNCRVISNTEGLVSKIMAPLISDQLHKDGHHHDQWCIIPHESLVLVTQLMATPGQTGTNLRREISGNKKESIISTLRRIIECCECGLSLKRQAAQVILDLPPDAISSSITASGSNSRRVFTWILLYIFLLPDNCFHKMGGSTHWLTKSSCIIKLAGEKLQEMLHPKSEGSDTVRAALGDLTRALQLDVHAENTTYRVHAAKILTHLYYDYEKDDEYLVELEKAVAMVLPEVIRKVIGYGSTREGSAPGIDLEKGGVSHDTDQETTSSHQQNGEEHGSKLQEALISLCKVIWWKRSFRDQANDIAAKICFEQKKPVKKLNDLVLEAEKFLEKKNAEESATVQASSSGKT